jgi:hypothetical protein
MVNFDEIVNDITRIKSINLVVLMNATNVLLMEYGNPILFTLSAAGSCVYVWLKIKREFYSKKEENK